MKRSFLLILLITVVIASNAQGNFAGSMKKLIGTKYKDSKSIAALKGYEYRAGSLITDINDPESITVDQFQKGADVVLFFSIMEDANSEEHTIMDVLEYKNVPKGWQIVAALCRQNETENVEIVALVKSGNEEILKPTKEAWRFSRDKRRLAALDVNGVDCLSEGGN
jgi:hypothetical protein